MNAFQPTQAFTASDVLRVAVPDVFCFFLELKRWQSDALLLVSEQSCSTEGHSAGGFLNDILISVFKGNRVLLVRFVLAN